MVLSTIEYRVYLVKMQQYRKSNHSVSLVNYHLVWIPKRRKRLLINNVEKRLIEIVWQVCQEKDWIIIALEIMPDHIVRFV